MVKVGGEVDSFCTKCELTLAHTVIAMVGGQPVKVQCNTCRGVHKFRGPPGAKTLRAAGKAAKPAVARSTVEKKRTISFEELLRERDLASAQRYSPKASYRLDQVIEHPTFGLGFVSAVRDAGKVEVTFKTDVKVLVHGKA